MSECLGASIPGNLYWHCMRAHSQNSVQGNGGEGEGAKEGDLLNPGHRFEESETLFPEPPVIRMVIG